MLKKLYKRIIRKLNLSVEQLKILKSRLTADNICCGAFTKDDKMCPNTNALAIKRGIERFESEQQVRVYLNNNGITNQELYPFYLLFDLPAMLSKKLFIKRLTILQHAIDELIQGKSFSQK